MHRGRQICSIASQVTVPASLHSLPHLHTDASNARKWKRLPDPTSCRRRNLLPHSSRRRSALDLEKLTFGKSWQFTSDRNVLQSGPMVLKGRISAIRENNIRGVSRPSSAPASRVIVPINSAISGFVATDRLDGRNPSYLTHRLVVAIHWATGPRISDAFRGLRHKGSCFLWTSVTLDEATGRPCGPLCYFKWPPFILIIGCDAPDVLRLLLSYSDLMGQVSRQFAIRISGN